MSEANLIETLIGAGLLFAVVALVHYLSGRK